MRRLFMDLLACLMPPIMEAYVAYEGILITNAYAMKSDARGASIIQFVVCLILICFGWALSAAWATLHAERYYDIS